MSQKINAKNLTYSQNLPPFLAALRDQVSGQAGPDPILAARRRPVKKRSASEEAEDAPLVLDEHGDVVVGVTVGVDGIAAMAAASANDTERRQPTQVAPDGQEGRLGEGVAVGTGTGKKRKTGKVVGGKDEDDDEGGKKDGLQRREKCMPEEGSEKKNVRSAEDKVDDARHAARERKKKKTKKIKLSFEDDGGTT